MQEYDVYFEDKNKQRRVIGKCTDETSLFQIINKFLDEHEYKSYYTQITLQGEEVCLDVGSWSEFFYVNKKALGM